MIGRLISSTDIGDEVRHFVFEVPDREKLEFVPGQFISLQATVDDRRITRAYSLASAPQGNLFELCLNRVKEGKMSPQLFAMQPGETVEFRGPLGYFTLRTPPADSVMIATGTGIAPFRGILKAHLAEHPQRQVTLILGVRYERNILYREEFETMAADFPNFRFWPTLSRPGEGWTGRSRHVQEHFAEAIGERKDIDVYLCGMKAMVDDIRARLKESGFERQHVIFEKYD